MTKCDLCGTQKAKSYGSVFNIGMVCHRCSLLAMGGPEMSMMPHCPPVPDDADPEVIALERKGMQPLTPEEFDEWVARSGNPYNSGKARVQDQFTGQKIEQWFSDQGGSVLCGVSPDPITFDVFEACAAKHPPSSADIPGIAEETAKAIILAFQMLIFILPHHPDLGEIIDGEVVGNTCGNCDKESATKVCGRCKKMKYCSKECQRLHWPVHKQSCGKH